MIVDRGDGGERPRRAVHESLERAVRDRHAGLSDGPIDAPEHRQVPLLVHRQGPHEHGIGDAEGRRGGANTDSEGRNRDETEGRPLCGRTERTPQLAATLTQMIEQRRTRTVRHISSSSFPGSSCDRHVVTYSVSLAVGDHEVRSSASSSTVLNSRASTSTLAGFSIIEL